MSEYWLLPVKAAELSTDQCLGRFSVSTFSLPSCHWPVIDAKQALLLCKRWRWHTCIPLAEHQLAFSTGSELALSFKETI